MRFGAGDVKSLYEEGSLVTVSKEYENMLDLLGMQEVGGDGRGTDSARESDKRVEFVSDGMSLVMYHCSQGFCQGQLLLGRGMYIQ
jgi:hypothetical protein